MRTRVAAISAAVVAVWLGSAVANQEMFLPAMVVGAAGLLVLVALQPVPLDALLLGAVLFGYIVGNRGFAQLHPPNLPLLPAEFVLLASAAIIGVRCTQQRALPLRRDALNLALLLWMALSSVRLYSDVRVYGFTALRDYATVYYAAFFFLGQQAATNPVGARFIRSALMAACVALAIVFPLFLRFPDVFFGPLAVNGVPLIFFKGDLAGTFLAVASILFYIRFELRGSLLALVASLLFGAGTIMTSNRASLLGLVVATAILALARRWRFAVVQGCAAIAAAVLILFVAYVRDISWQKTPLYGAYERAVSLVDPRGERTYSAPDAVSKGDNNRFRLVWWQAVYDETVATAPFVGLGYGHDLAQRFLEAYYPDTNEEFSTRSPHNIAITVFARSGLIGFLPFVLVVGLVFTRTIRATRRDLANAGLWLSACVIFVSACFGVVLEGPMGGVVFWTVLGTANAAWYADSSNEAVVATDPVGADANTAALERR